MDSTENSLNVRTRVNRSIGVSKPAEIGGLKKKKDSRNKKMIASIAVLVVGLITLVVGVVFLVLGMNGKVAVADGEYLVAAENWALASECGAEDECEPMVVWDFTEIGKGTLTTDAHKHDYDFIWAIEDGKLLIETDWLYELEDKYEYSLDQENGILMLKTEDGEEYKFVAQS